MNRRTRVRIALVATLPTLLTLPIICLLAVVGVVPWALLLAVPVALLVHAGINFLRLGPEPPAAGPGRPTIGPQ